MLENSHPKTIRSISMNVGDDVAAMHPSLSGTAAVARAPRGCTALWDGWCLQQAPPLRSDGPPTCGTAVPLAVPPKHGHADAARLSPATHSASQPTTDAGRRQRAPLPLSASPCLRLAACGVAFNAAPAGRGSVVSARMFQCCRPGCRWLDTAAGVGREKGWGSGRGLGGFAPEACFLPPAMLRDTPAEPQSRSSEPTLAHGSATATRLHYFFHRRRARCTHQEGDGTKGGGTFASAAAAAVREATGMPAPAACDGE